MTISDKDLVTPSAHSSSTRMPADDHPTETTGAATSARPDPPW
ncbi:MULTISPECIES: hypothetical protein [unclassified Gordonia (in: high G+C Gram-positive bacteria)]|nr:MULTISPECIES: hypothetical protein [unclassified Gordonia (in: high G+C Gram-positive bacteria)]